MLMFRNDYSYGAHPKVLEALCKTNLEGNIGYGDDAYTDRAKALIRELCACPEAMVEFLIGGTQTNVTACAFLLKPWEAVISPSTGHLNGHEVGAFEATGHKILPVEVGSDGKIFPEMLPPLLERHQDPHLTKPALVYISNATENGTVYTKAELTALYEFCRANGLFLFVDGARLGAALTSTENDLSLAEFAHLTDAFYIGGTKNGALMGEAMVLTDPDLQPHFFRAMKQRGAVLAKGFLLGAQFEALLEDGLYWDLARHSNAMAGRLRAGLEEKGIDFLVDSPTNQLFPIFAKEQLPRLEELCSFEVWEDVDETRTAVRFVTSFATSPEDVDGLLAAL